MIELLPGVDQASTARCWSWASPAVGRPSAPMEGPHPAPFEQRERDGPIRPAPLREHRYAGLVSR